MLVIRGPKYMPKLQLVHCHALEKMIDNRFPEMRSEFSQASTVNKWRP